MVAKFTRYGALFLSLSEVETHGQLFTKPEQLLEWVDKGILIQCNMASFNP